MRDKRRQRIPHRWLVDQHDVEAQRLQRLFPADEYYTPPLEVMEEEGQRPAFGHFNILHRDTALRADVYLAGDDPLHAWALSARRLVPMEEGMVWFAPVEYVITRKLEYFRESGSDRHLIDVRGIVRVSGESIDMTTLDRLLDERRLSDLWERARNS